MSFYGSMHVRFIKAATEEKLQLQVTELEIEHDSMIKVINVYRGSSGVVMWYYHDWQKAGAPKIIKEGDKVTKKKATKKKATKKKAN